MYIKLILSALTILSQISFASAEMNFPESDLVLHQENGLNLLRVQVGFSDITIINKDEERVYAVQTKPSKKIDSGQEIALMTLFYGSEKDTGPCSFVAFINREKSDSSIELSYPSLEIVPKDWCSKQRASTILGTYILEEAN